MYIGSTKMHKMEKNSFRFGGFSESNNSVLSSQRSQKSYVEKLRERFKGFSFIDRNMGYLTCMNGREIIRHLENVQVAVKRFDGISEVELEVGNGNNLRINHLGKDHFFKILSSHFNTTQFAIFALSKAFGGEFDYIETVKRKMMEDFSVSEESIEDDVISIILRYEPVGEGFSSYVYYSLHDDSVIVYVTFDSSLDDFSLRFSMKRCQYLRSKGIMDMILSCGNHTKRITDGLFL